MIKKHNISIIIDPRCYINYASYYILGIKMSNISYAFKVIKGITINKDLMRKGMLMIINDTENALSQKVYIDFDDPDTVNEDIYEWCDLYAKINVAQTETRSKVIPIGPSFSVRPWSMPQALIMLLQNYIKIRKQKLCSFKSLALNYLYLYIRRLPYNAYGQAKESNESYAFHFSQLWWFEDTKEANRLRAAFMRSCKKVLSTFEGGFYLIPYFHKTSDKYKEMAREYTDLLSNNRISLKKYIQNTQKSICVFNTPSVHHCHGWKLAEYLSMGKAILSTPLSNKMPVPFINGYHYIEVKSEKDILNQINIIYNTKEVRKQLEQHSLEYFQQNLSPTVAIERIINAIIP